MQYRLAGMALAAFLALITDAALAHGAGGGTMGGAHGNFGGMSANHTSAQGLAHTNGPNAADRDFGRDRAEDRMNAHATHHARTAHRVSTATHARRATPREMAHTVSI